MNTLRVLLVGCDPERSQAVLSTLASKSHIVRTAHGLQEASKVLCSEKFDAVVLGSPITRECAADFARNLRETETNQGGASRTAILSVSSEISDTLAWHASDDKTVNAYLPECFEPGALVDAIMNLARALSTPKNAADAAGSKDLPIFEPEEFEAQVAYDRDLLIEIIDIFLSERPAHVAQLRAALAAGEYDRIYRVAHTMKGSLGTLHATRARFHAEELESVARKQDHEQCAVLIGVLNRDLDALEPTLTELRHSCDVR